MAVPSAGPETTNVAPDSVPICRGSPAGTTSVSPGDRSMVSALGRRSPYRRADAQTAAKTAAGLERAGYVARSTVPRDRRAVLLRRTARGEELLTASEAGFERVMDRWRRQLGGARFDAMVQALAEVAGDRPVGDLPGWLTQRSVPER